MGTGNGAVTIRALTDPDIEAAARLLTLPGRADESARLHASLAAIAAGGADGAWVARRGRVVVGAAMAVANKVFTGTVSSLVVVDRDERRQGIGGQLAERLVQHLDGLGPGNTGTCSIEDDQLDTRRFAKRFGFDVASHSVGWRFEVAGKRAELVARAETTATTAGVRIRPVQFAAAEAQLVDLLRRVHTEDMPMPFGHSQHDIDFGVGMRSLPGSAIVLVAEPAGEPGGAPLGLSVITPRPGTTLWYTNFTGVDAESRGRGVATALKAALLRTAEHHGATVVTTHNDEHNTPILRVNESVGMTPTVGYWGLVRPAAA
jgi:GNAT superfamily N-acetyltransferase